MSSSITPRLQILVAALLFSTGGVAVKSCAFSSWQVASLRSAFAVLTLVLTMKAARKRGSWRSLLVGFAYASTLTLFVLANKTTTSANAIFLQAAAPVYILLLGPWWLGEKIRRHDVGVIVLMIVGLLLFFVGEEPASQTAPQPALGNLLAALAGICWALTVIGLRFIGRSEGSGSNDSAVTAVVAGNLMTFLFCLPMAWPISVGHGIDWLWLAYLGIFQIGLAYGLLSSGVRSVPALEVSVLLLLEPVLNPFWSWWVHDETPSRFALWGGVLILLATAIKPWLDFRDVRRTRAIVGIPSVRP